MIPRISRLISVRFLYLEGGFSNIAPLAEMPVLEVLDLSRATCYNLGAMRASRSLRTVRLPDSLVDDEIRDWKALLNISQ